MTLKDFTTQKTLANGFRLSAVCLCVATAAFIAFGAKRAIAFGSSAPLVKVLSRFTASDVPEMGASETEVPVKTWNHDSPDGLPGKGMAQHSMLYFGEGYNKMFVVNDGKVIWTYSTGKDGEYDDAWMLSNGNVLFTRLQYIAEVTPEKKEIWHYDAPQGTEIHACAPIGLDKVVLIENGLPPKLKVINIKTKAVEVEHELPAPSATDRRTVHAQFRRVRYTSKGTYLIPFLEMGKVIEYDKNFKEIWSQEIKSPWSAVRLKNGNTLITDEDDKLTQEVSPDHKIVWELRPGDLPAAYAFANTQSATRLANGNTVICSRGGRNSGIQLVEVTPEKKVAWVLQDWTKLGPATAVQMLDEPGKPEKPGESFR